MSDDAEILALHRLKSRYFRFLDTKDWARWRELFTDDLVFYIEATMLPTTTEPTTVGGDEFVEYVSNLLRTSTTVHHGHMPDLELLDGRTARGIWAMYDWVDDLEGNRAIQGWGHYHERYEKGADGAWRIAELRLTRLRVDAVQPTPPPADRRFPAPSWKRDQRPAAGTTS